MSLPGPPVSQSYPGPPDEGVVVTVQGLYPSPPMSHHPHSRTGCVAGAADEGVVAGIRPQSRSLPVSADPGCRRRLGPATGHRRLPPSKGLSRGSPNIIKSRPVRSMSYCIWRFGPSDPLASIDTRVWVALRHVRRRGWV